MTKSKVSLSEFAASYTRPRTCSVCTKLPEEVLAELNEGLRSGIGSALGSQWLRTEGHQLTYGMVEHHRREGHANAGSSENVTQGPEFVTRRGQR